MAPRMSEEDTILISRTCARVENLLQFEVASCLERLLDRRSHLEIPDDLNALLEPFLQEICKKSCLELRSALTLGIPRILRLFPEDPSEAAGLTPESSLDTAAELGSELKPPTMDSASDFATPLPNASNQGGDCLSTFFEPTSSAPMQGFVPMHRTSALGVASAQLGSPAPSHRAGSVSLDLPRQGKLQMASCPSNIQVASCSSDCNINRMGSVQLVASNMSMPFDSNFSSDPNSGPFQLLPFGSITGPAPLPQASLLQEQHVLMLQDQLNNVQLQLRGFQQVSEEALPVQSTRGHTGRHPGVQAYQSTPQFHNLYHDMHSSGGSIDTAHTYGVDAAHTYGVDAARTYGVMNVDPSSWSLSGIDSGNHSGSHAFMSSGTAASSFPMMMESLGEDDQMWSLPCSNTTPMTQDHTQMQMMGVSVLPCSDNLDLSQQYMTAQPQDASSSAPWSVGAKDLPPAVLLRLRQLLRNTKALTELDFDDKVVAKMSSLIEIYGADECCAMLSHLEDRVRSKQGRMKNGPGYIDVAVSSHVDKLSSRGTVPMNVSIKEFAVRELPKPVVRQLYVTLEDNRCLKWEHIDQGIIQVLQRLSPESAVDKLREITHHSFKNVENVRGCLMSILNSKLREERRSTSIARFGMMQDVQQQQLNQQMQQQQQQLQDMQQQHMQQQQLQQQLQDMQQQLQQFRGR